MFDIYIKNYNKDGNIVTTETLVQSIPAEHQAELYFDSPIVKNEMGNAESFDFSIEAATPYYDAFLQMKTYVRVTYDGDDIFYGRVLTIDNNTFRRTRRIRCEGAFTFLLDSPVEGIPELKRGNTNIKSYIENLLNSHNNYVNDSNKNFEIGEIPGHYSASVSEEQKIKEDARKYGSDSWTDTKSALEDLRSHYGGFFRTRTRPQGGVYLDWMNHYFNATENPQTVEVGKNILDISDVTEIDNIFTAIIPIGKKNSNKDNGALYIEDYRTDVHGNGKILKVPDICSIYTDEQLNSGYHRADYYRNAINNYGTIIKPVTFNDAKTQEKLFNDACEWIKNNYQGEVVKFTIKAVDMRQIGHNTTKISVGDQVRIRYLVGDEDGIFSWNEILLTCLSISFDLYHPENNSYTFGIPANVLTKTYGIKQSKSVKSGVTAEKKEDEKSEEVDLEHDWLDQVNGWLMEHALYYNGPRPWEPMYGSAKDGSPYESGPRLLDMPFGARGRLVHAHKIINPDPQEDRTYEGFIDYLPEGATYPTRHILGIYYVIEYVASEYGFDLRNGLPAKMPKVVIDQETGDITGYQDIVDPETGEVTTLEAWYRSSSGLVILDRDGETIKSYLDPDGVYHYYWLNPATGIIEETNIRDLNIKQLDTDRKVGWVVTEDDSTGEMYFTNPGNMVMAIENAKSGELLVTYLSGEKMFIGNSMTKDLDAVSLEHMYSVTGDFYYVTDPNTGLKTVYLRSGGGMRVEHAKIIGYNEHTIPPTPIYETTSDGRIVTAEFGVFDDNTLTSGVLVERLSDGKDITHIRGDLVVLEANSGYAQLIVDTSYIRAEVSDAQSRISSVILQTSTLIHTEVKSEVAGIYQSVIDQTATYIRTEVSEAASKIAESVIEQTAEYIQTTVSAIASGIAWSVITQTATDIMTEVVRKARVYVQLEDPCSTYDVHEGDIWVQCEDKRKHSELGSLTLSALSYKRLRDLYGALVYVYRSGVWELMIDQAAIHESEIHVEQTSDYFKVWGRAVDLLGEEYRSNLTVTAQKISSDVSTAKSNIYSSIAQTATNITLKVADEIKGVQSSIEQTAESITLSVSAAKSSLYSVIEQTATSIRLQVANELDGLSTAIEQTASNINISANNVKNEVRGWINVQADRIDLVVEGTGDDARVKRAAIVAAINENAQSTVDISADKITLDGGTTKLSGVMSVNEDYVSIRRKAFFSGDVRIEGGHSLTFQTSGTPGKSYVFSPSVLDKLIFEAVKSGNILRLRQGNGEYLDFSKAVTGFDSGWSGGTLTVTPKPQDSPSFTTSITYGQPYKDSDGHWKRKLYALGTGTPPEEIYIGRDVNLYLNLQSLTGSNKITSNGTYTPSVDGIVGYDTVVVDVNTTPTLSVDISNNRINVTSTPAPASTYVRAFSHSAPYSVSSGGEYIWQQDIYYYDPNATNPTYYNTGHKINLSNYLEERSVTIRSNTTTTYSTVSSGKIGLSSIKVTTNVSGGSYAHSVNLKCSNVSTSGGLTTYTFTYQNTNASMFTSNTTYSMHYN